ncbi:MAG: ParA family protein [Fusobacterium varium]|uniref:ParA family protein n=1 Tax=Fusobacterium varium TaxID=856 RepID=UPI00242CC343|nr:ParA family protein [Fusobacterium varium]MCF0171804.1 ParA family protein [Fusobacterium varium]
MSKTIVVMTEKGGTGKTTGAREIAGVLSKEYKVLLIDIDFQRNLTKSFEFDSSKNIYDAIINKDFKNNIVEINDSLDLIPGDLRTRNIDDDLKISIESEIIIKEQIQKLDGYDYIIIDCRPDLKKIEKNALIAADIILTPVEPHSFSLEGFDLLEGFIQSIKSLLKSSVQHVGYLSRVPNDKSFMEAMGEVTEDYKKVLLETVIRENVKLKEASMCSEFVIDYSPRSNGAVDFKNLVKELNEKYGI